MVLKYFVAADTFLSHFNSPCVYILLLDVGLDVHANSVTALVWELLVGCSKSPPLYH